jgi:hypothetical protein
MEDWKDIPNYEGLYKVSNMGNIKSLYKEYNLPNGGIRKCDEKIMKCGMSGEYRVVLLFKNGKRKYFYIHRLVASLFILNPDNLPEVNHKKGIKIDNRSSELEWVTRSQNIKHAYDVLNKKANKNGFDRETKQMSLNGSLVKTFESRNAAAKEMGVTSTAILNCILGKSKTCAGYKWQ